MYANFFITAWRNLGKNKIHTTLNITGLSIGIVVCLFICVWLQRELSFDNFHPDGDQIFRITNTFKSQSEVFSQAPSGVALAAQLPKQLPIIKSACRVFQFEHKFRVGNNSFFEHHTFVADSNFFSFFGFQLQQGQARLVLNSPDLLVLTEKTAFKYFGTTKRIVGRTMLMDEHPMIVAGVAQNPPVNSHLQFDAVIPYTNFRNYGIANWKEDLDEDWVGGWPYVYVKLAKESNRTNAERQINEVIAKFSEKIWEENKMSYQYFLQPIGDIHLKSQLRYDSSNNGSLYIVNIFTIVGIIVLLLACINYINLTTAGAIKRAKETSVRKVIGATKSQLIRQFFLETFIICSISVIIGLTLFKALLPSFSAWISQPYNFLITPINILLIFSFVIFVSAISGIYPAFMISSFKPALSLKGVFSQSKHGSLIRKSLVVFQFTITISSVLIVKQQMNFINNTSLGFNDNALIEINFNGDETVLKSYNQLRNELLQNPYILNVSEQESNIVGGLGNGWTTTQNLKGEEVSTSIYRLNVSPDYFKTYNMKLAAGRFFSEDVPTDSAQSVLVNEAAVRTFGWKTPSNALGKPFGPKEDRKYVIGVVKDFNFENLHKQVEALLIGHVRQANSISIKMKSGHIHETIEQLTKIWKKIAPSVPFQYSFIEERISNQYGSEQKMQSIFYGLSTLSLLIACLGLFGLSIFIVERKVKEIGIRKVLGAKISGIVNLLSKDFLKLILISVLIASPLAWYLMNNWIREFAYHIKISWLVFVLSGCTAIIIAFLTISIQSIKAALANPITSLKTE